MKNNNLNLTIEKYFKETSIVKAETLKDCKSSIVEAANLIAKQLKQSKKILICGNGGSAADSIHLATEFTNRFSKSINRLLDSDSKEKQKQRKEYVKKYSWFNTVDKMLDLIKKKL